jgi:molybdopterin molybdotransferase
MLKPEEAWKSISLRLEPLSGRLVTRSEALGTTLAEPLRATVDMPPADVSAMDGYACAGKMSPGESVQVVGTVAAGSPATFALPPGTAAKIMTGAVVPAGADRVIQVELSEPGDAADRVVFTTEAPPGLHIRRGGEVVRCGEKLLAAGALLSPGAISLLAAHGFEQLRVVRPPEVAVIVTGDEVVDPADEPGPGQLRDSNSAFLLAAGRVQGLDFKRLGIAPDRPEALRAMIAQGLEADVLLLSGGVSMGEFDLVEDVLAELGCETVFDQVAIQPGKPLVAATHAGGWVFGLPGNPASVMATFYLFVRPLLRRLMGLDDGFWHGAIAGELAASLPGAKGRDRFLPASVAFDAGRLLVTPHTPTGSHDVAAYARGSALVRLRPHAAPAGVGEPCEILLLVNWCDQYPDS